MTALAPLFPCLRAVSDIGSASSVKRKAVAEGDLFLAPATVPTTDLVYRGVTRLFGVWPRRWRFDHDLAGAPLIRDDAGTSPAISIAASRCTRALLLGAGPIGVDVETLDRVDANAGADDDWLAPEERALLYRLARDDRVLELACRWVLREAHGKASGRGLDLPLGRFAFTVRSGAVVLPVNGLAGDDWTYSLHRRGNLVIGIVAARSGR